MEKYFSRNERAFDDASALIIAHECEELEIPARWKDKTHFVGQIVRPMTESNDTLQAEDILITGGGGGSPSTIEFYNLAIMAFALCRSEQSNLRALLITGPLFSEWNSLLLVEGLKVIPKRWDLPNCAVRTRLTICQGGYNTVGEILRTGAMTICLPGTRFFDDQFKRAASVARSHPQFRLFEGDKPEGLAVLIKSILARPRTFSVAPDKFEGDQRSADVVAQIVK
jgi:predicted glycosyltransferase